MRFCFSDFAKCLSPVATKNKGHKYCRRNLRTGEKIKEANENSGNSYPGFQKHTETTQTFRTQMCEKSNENIPKKI